MIKKLTCLLGLHSWAYGKTSARRYGDRFDLRVCTKCGRKEAWEFHMSGCSTWRKYD